MGGRIPNDQLFSDGQLINTIQNVFLTGDCLVPGTIQASVLSGHQTARKNLDRDADILYSKREQTIQ